VNPDIRGALHSDGDIHFWGRFDALDARDLIEWLAAREWCQGKIGLAGNSWLAISNGSLPPNTRRIWQRSLRGRESMTCIGIP